MQEYAAVLGPAYLASLASPLDATAFVASLPSPDAPAAATPGDGTTEPAPVDAPSEDAAPAATEPVPADPAPRNNAGATAPALLTLVAMLVAAMA